MKSPVLYPKPPAAVAEGVFCVIRQSRCNRVARVLAATPSHVVVDCRGRLVRVPRARLVEAEARAAETIPADRLAAAVAMLNGGRK